MVHFFLNRLLARVERKKVQFGIKLDIIYIGYWNYVIYQICWPFGIMLTADMSFYRLLIRTIWHSLATTNQRGGTTVVDKTTLGKNLLRPYYRRFFIHPECLHLQGFLSRHYLYWDWLRMSYNLLNENREKNSISRVEWFWCFVLSKWHRNIFSSKEYFTIISSVTFHITCLYGNRNSFNHQCVFH